MAAELGKLVDRELHAAMPGCRVGPLASSGVYVRAWPPLRTSPSVVARRPQRVVWMPAVCSCIKVPLDLAARVGGARPLTG